MHKQIITKANFNTLFELPANTTHLICWELELTELPPLPPGLISLNCRDNCLTWLPALPETLRELICRKNALTFLPPLPEGLEALVCDANDIRELPSNLPPGLKKLYCAGCPLADVGLPTLPDTLEELVCFGCGLTQLSPKLPAKLRVLSCHTNLLTDLPPLPETVRTLYCYANRLRNIAEFPPNLERLECQDNQLEDLPELPVSLTEMVITGNGIPAARIQALEKKIRLRDALLKTKIVEKFFVGKRPAAEADADADTEADADPDAEEDECPICFVETQHIEVQCTHKFCECILFNIIANQKNSNLCPICRTPISVLGFTKPDILQICLDYRPNVFIAE